MHAFASAFHGRGSGNHSGVLRRSFDHFCGDSPPRFAHPSERLLAEMLDSAGVAWDYEPHTFALERDRRGRVTRAFTPDFFLPDAGIYIELTTQPPKHLTRKRRKVRETQRQYGAVVVLHERHRFEQLCARYPRRSRE